MFLWVTTGNYAMDARVLQSFDLIRAPRSKVCWCHDEVARSGYYELRQFVFLVVASGRKDAV
jgi:hypothetical protein